VQYDYDTLKRVKEARDAIALRDGTRDPHVFLLADGARGVRVDPANGRYTVEYDADGRPNRYRDELNRDTLAESDGRGRVTKYTYPELDQEVVAYDDRNNVLSVTRKAKPASGLADLVVSATWDTNWNKPLMIVDARGFTTDFAYYGVGVNGASLLQSATRPAPAAGGTRPVYGFTYNNRGQLLDATDPTGLVSRSTYSATSGNRLTSTLDPTGINAVTNFDLYDAQGDLLTQRDPRGNASEFSYDAARRRTVTRQHDGGTGTALLAAQRTTYDVLGRVTREEAGTAFAGSTVTAWQTLDTRTYTATSQVASAANGAGESTSYLYDALDRAVLVTDPVGRRVGAVFDAAGQESCSWRGWDSATAPATCSWSPSGYAGGKVRYAQYGYSANGQRTTVDDANNNRSVFEYDGFDRQVKWRFPVITAGSLTASTTDYEQYTYDGNGNRTSLRKRDGQVIGYTYDRLNRVTVKDWPVGTADDVYYGYDDAGRPTYLRYTSTGGQGIDYGYDTARRLTSESSFTRTVSFQYDLAGNRTRLTWPDGNYVQSVYDNLNRLTELRENGASSGAGRLDVLGYDALSRRT
jgi:YD repeat-containing protein